MGPRRGPQQCLQLWTGLPPGGPGIHPSPKPACCPGCSGLKEPFGGQRRGLCLAARLPGSRINLRLVIIAQEGGSLHSAKWWQSARQETQDQRVKGPAALICNCLKWEHHALTHLPHGIRNANKAAALLSGCPRDGVISANPTQGQVPELADKPSPRKSYKNRDTLRAI